MIASPPIHLSSLFMAATKTCAQCGAELPDRNLGGRCPRCLLSLALENVREEPAVATPDEPASKPGGEGPHSAPVFPGVRLFGDYDLIEEVARGGMGVVYKARQRSLNRVVALKMILAGQFASKQEVLRFRGEAESAGNLRHPNIVPIYETGECDGQHFFSMEYVQGRNLADIVRDGPLAARRAARYVQVISEAIHYAHEQGTLHRDLKPSNVLIDANDQPRITDFGLAKRVRGDFGLTITGQVLGSPNFMPPEQCGFGTGRAGEILKSESETEHQGARIVQPPAVPVGPKAQVGPWSDVYGIGAILYHLLTGRPPFHAEAVTDVLLQLREREPVAPRQLSSSVPRDLETICLKCLEKQPAKRYQTARAVADELGRFVRGEPILARPVTRLERTWRWCRRKPVLAGLSATTAVLLVGVAIGAPVALYRINQESSARRQQLYAAEANLASQALADDDLKRARGLLERQPGDLRGFEWRYLYGQCHSDELTTLSRSDKAVLAVRFSPAGKVLASWQGTGAIDLWDYQAQKHLRTLRDPRNEVTDEIPDFESALAFSPDGRRLAGGAGTNILVWDMDTHQRTAVLRGHTGLVCFLVFAPDGKTLASGGADGTVRLWTVLADEVRGAAALPTDFHSVDRLAFSPDGKTLLGCCGGDNTIQRWNVSDLNAPLALPPLLGHSYGGVIGLAFAPHTNLLVSISNDLIAWRLASDPNVYSLRRLPLGRVPIGVPAGLVFTPDGKNVVSGGSDQNITVWDPSGQEEPIKLRGHEGMVYSVDVSPDGRTLASGGNDGTLKLWDFTSPWQWKQRTPTLSHTGFVCAVTFSADSKLLASAGVKGEVRLWDAASEELLATCNVAPGNSDSLAFSPDGSVLAVEDAGMIRLRTVPLLNESTNFPGAHPTFSRSGSELVYFLAEGGQRGIHWRNLKTQQERIWQTDWRDVRCLALATDGHTIAAGVRNRVFLLNAESPVRAKEMGKPGNDMVSQLAFSPDGGMLTSANWDGETRLWDLRDPRQTMKPFAAHHGEVWAVAFSPDGRTLATGGDDYTVKLWNLASLQEAAVLRGHTALVAGLAFSPDGRQLASCGGDGTVRLWRAPTFAEIAAEQKGKEKRK